MNTQSLSLIAEVVSFIGFFGIIFSVVYMIVVQRRISLSLSKIAESKRLSTILSIEGKEVKTTPEDFEPNKKEILNKLLKALEENKDTNYNPDTYAFVILNHSGWDSFVTNESRSNAKKALSRLLANGDMEKAKIFLTDLANQL